MKFLRNYVLPDSARYHLRSEILRTRSWNDPPRTIPSPLLRRGVRAIPEREKTRSARAGITSIMSTSGTNTERGATRETSGHSVFTYVEDQRSWSTRTTCHTHTHALSSRSWMLATRSIVFSSIRMEIQMTTWIVTNDLNATDFRSNSSRPSFQFEKRELFAPNTSE